MYIYIYIPTYMLAHEVRRVYLYRPVQVAGALGALAATHFGSSTAVVVKGIQMGSAQKGLSQTRDLNQNC